MAQPADLVKRTSLLVKIVLGIVMFGLGLASLIILT